MEGIDQSSAGLGCGGGAATSTCIRTATARWCTRTRTCTSIRAPSPTPEEHAHAHPERLGRTPLAAFGLGLLHGVGGSAGIGILLVGAVSSGTGAAAALVLFAGAAPASMALVLFAGAAAASMALVSATLGSALVRPAVRHRLGALVPVLGSAGLLFGVFYMLAAV